MTPFDRALARAERLERECLEWQAALHHAETEARQCGFTGSIREPGPALLAILQERDALSHQLEADRTAVADAVTNLRRELNSRHWLTEGRGPYEWDDDRYREEFLLAGRALIAAIEPLNKVAVNWAGCPKTSAEVAKARIDKDARITELRCSLNDALESLDEALRERDDARAQAARLAEALKAEIHCQTCDGTGIMGDECERCSAYGYFAANCGRCQGTGKWEAECAECDGTKQSSRSKLSIAALTSTNSRAWLDEQIAAELESWRAARAIKPECVVEVDERIAELLRKEPCCGCVCPQAPDKDRHCPCGCHDELRRKEGE